MVVVGGGVGGRSLSNERKNFQSLGWCWRNQNVDGNVWLLIKGERNYDVREYVLLCA